LRNSCQKQKKGAMMGEGDKSLPLIEKKKKAFRGRVLEPSGAG